MIWARTHLGELVVLCSGDFGRCTLKIKEGGTRGLRRAYYPQRGIGFCVTECAQ